MNVSVNGVDFPLRDQNGILAIEDEDGTQHWAMVQHAKVNYVDQEIVSDREFRMELQVTLAPGQTLLMADSTDADEENVLMYSRLLVALLREERERYAELEKRFSEQSVQLRKAREEAGALVRDRDEMLYAAWRDGASTGWMMHDLPPHVMLSKNPHPEPEEEGCHVCGGADH